LGDVDVLRDQAVTLEAAKKVFEQLLPGPLFIWIIWTLPSR